MGTNGNGPGRPAPRTVPGWVTLTKRTHGQDTHQELLSVASQIFIARPAEPTELPAQVDAQDIADLLIAFGLCTQAGPT